MTTFDLGAYRIGATECTTEECASPPHARGMCEYHYNQAWKRKELPPKLTPSQRFWQRVDTTAEGCWNWTGYRTTLGYGQVHGGFAHRMAYQYAVGPIPDGLVLDHLCRNPSCVRPDHLEAVTQLENMRRGESPPARQARMTRCSKGHEFTPENTQVDRKGKRRCRICNRAWERAWKAARRNAA